MELDTFLHQSLVLASTGFLFPAPPGSRRLLRDFPAPLRAESIRAGLPAH
jgi:hypothetical protein